MYEGNGEIPKFLKLIMVFIDRVGFPVLAFCLMFYFAFFTLQKMTIALAENTRVLNVTSVFTQEALKTVQTNQGIIMADLKDIMIRK
jgi:hypothetical protein